MHTPSETAHRRAGEQPRCQAGGPGGPELWRLRRGSRGGGRLWRGGSGCAHLCHCPRLACSTDSSPCQPLARAGRPSSETDRRTAEWRANSFADSQTGRAGRWQRLPKSPPKASALHWPQPLARAAASTQPATGRANSLAAGRTARPERRRRRRGGPGGGREVWRGGNGGVSPSKASAQLLSACCSPWRESARLRAKQPAAGRRGARRENSLPACRAALRSAAQGPF